MLVRLFTETYLNYLVTRSKHLTLCSGLRTLLCSLLRMIELSITMIGSVGLLLSFLEMFRVKQSLPILRSPLLLRLKQMKLFDGLALAVLCLIEILLLFILLGVIMH